MYEASEHKESVGNKIPDNFVSTEYDNG